MSKLPRVIIPGLPHHITQRGNRRCDIFLDPEDRQVFMHILTEASRRYSLHHTSYCLMTNHIHLVSAPEYEGSISAAMRDSLGPYAVYFNNKYALKGHLWQGRYYACALDAPRFWAAVGYVERNPVRAGMVERAEMYRWSSAAAHCGLRGDPIVEPLPESPSSIRCWSMWLAEEEGEALLKAIRLNTSTGRPYGSEEFVRGLELRLGRRLLVRPGGRPRRSKSSQWFEFGDSKGDSPATDD